MNVRVSLEALMRRPVIVSPVVLLDSRLSLEARGVVAVALALLHTTHGDDGETIDAQIMLSCGISRDALDAYEAELVAAGYLIDGRLTDDPEAEIAHAEWESRRGAINSQVERAARQSNLYLIRSGDFHKIGISQDPAKRFRQIQTSAPHPVKVVGTWPMPEDVAISCESSWHAHFANKRKSGEWFDLTYDDVCLILAQMGGGR